MDVLGTLTLPIVPSVPDNADGESGAMVMVQGDGPHYHNGVKWVRYHEGSRVFMGTRPTSPEPYDIFYPVESSGGGGTSVTHVATFGVGASRTLSKPAEVTLQSGDLLLLSAVIRGDSNLPGPPANFTQVQMRPGAQRADAELGCWQDSSDGTETSWSMDDTNQVPRFLAMTVLRSSDPTTPIAVSHIEQASAVSAGYLEELAYTDDGSMLVGVAGVCAGAFTTANITVPPEMAERYYAGETNGDATMMVATEDLATAGTSPARLFGIGGSGPAAPTMLTVVVAPA